MKRFFPLVFLLLLILVGCRDFEPAQLELKVVYDVNTGDAICETEIKEDGGCPHFTEQGICYGFYSEPSHIDGYSEIVTVNKDTRELLYNYKVNLPIPDTVYYFRAFIKTNAGIGYSNIVEVSTHVSE